MWPAPPWHVRDHAFAYVCLAAFSSSPCSSSICGARPRGWRSTRSAGAHPGARTLGISVVQMKIIVAGLGAMVAGIGGGFLVTAQTSAQPADFDTFLGVVWLAALVTIGVRSNAAGAGGRPDLHDVARARPGLPSGLDGAATRHPLRSGAIGVAKFPDGTLEQAGRCSAAAC